MIGGGLAGWSVAFALAEAGAPATVVDAGHADNATQAGAGMITPGVVLDPVLIESEAAYLALASHAMAHYPQLIERLAERGQHETGYAVTGGLMLALSEDEETRLPAMARNLERRRAAGLGAIGDVTLLDKEGVSSYLPIAGPEVRGGVHFTDGARISGRGLRAALRAAALSLGAREHVGEVSLSRGGNTVTVADAAGERWEPDAVVLATGAWTGQIGAQLGLSLPVRPQRGQIAHVHLPGAGGERWPVVERFSGHYLIGFEGDRIVCGATRELDAGFDGRVTAAGLAEVLDRALSIAPELGVASLIETRVGLRPWTPDRLPLLGPAPGVGHLHLCAGHGAWGLQLAPASGRLIADALLGRSLEIDLAPYRTDRFT